MARVVLFHYNRRVRERVADALRKAGCLVYAAEDTARAWDAAVVLKPDVVVTDFPALLEKNNTHSLTTLTEAIRSHPELKHTAILNLSGETAPDIGHYAQAAGVTASVGPVVPSQIVVAAVHQLAHASVQN